MANSPTETGFRFPTWETCITEEHQQEKLACCEIDSAVFSDFLDVTILATDTILASKNAGYSINGMVHMSQRFVQHKAIRLGEKLSASGYVTEVKDVPRGKVIVSKFTYTQRDGSIPFQTIKTSLQLHAGKASNKKPVAKREARTKYDEKLLEWQLRPELVRRHSRDGDNLIHSDPQVAKRFGFRAPIAGGLMAVHHMMAALSLHGTIEELDMEVRFRRPMFWDDNLTLKAARADKNQISSMAFWGQDGKLMNECDIDRLTYV